MKQCNLPMLKPHVCIILYFMFIPLLTPYQGEILIYHMINNVIALLMQRLKQYSETNLQGYLELNIFVSKGSYL